MSTASPPPAPRAPSLLSVSDSQSARSRPRRPRVASILGLTLLEVIRSQDLPTEILEAEDPTVTMPRRLGLSDVIDRQIRTYREEVRKRRRMSDDQVRDLVRLVIRRPDSEEVFFRAGRILATRKGSDEPDRHGWQRILPGGIAFFLARRQAEKRFSQLFGRRFGGFAAGPFVLEARSHLLIEADPGGEGCAFITGLSEAVVQTWVGPGWRVAHGQCQSRKDPLCRWSVLSEERAGQAEHVNDFILNPEPG